MKCGSTPTVAELARGTDLLLVFGGDGTMLRVAREVAGLPTPILGVKVGGLGFLTHVPSGEVAGALRKVWAGDYSTEVRPLIAASGTARAQPFTEQALNDFVVSRGGSSRLIEVRVWVDQQVLTDYRCDGLIISSPTGSTAYSLAAGGAIVSPNAEVLTLTPICPHTLSNRSVIVPLSAVVKVQVLSERVETIVTADGQVQLPMEAGDFIEVRRSRAGIRLLNPGGACFFETLQRKLHWSGTNV
ncbi:MAG: NAD(+)/NADH kinase [Verrucomicrobia bacterium]|nr:NAD(+)/NADH kinase [Verrucomicrobiota bacterium]